MERDIKTKAKDIYANSNQVQIDEINIQLNEKHLKTMDECISNLFQMLMKDKGK